MVSDSLGVAADGVVGGEVGVEQGRDVAHEGAPRLGHLDPIAVPEREAVSLEAFQGLSRGKQRRGRGLAFIDPWLGLS